MTEHDALVGLLNQYRSAEIRGAGVILRFNRLAETAELRANFSRHLRDEAEHAWRWTEAIIALGGEVVDVEDPYQSRLGTLFGMPHSVAELLALTLVSERRGLATYRAHLKVPDSPPVVRDALKAIVSDERWHVQWIGDELQRRSADVPEVADMILRAEEADRIAVQQLSEELDPEVRTRLDTVLFR